MASASLKNLEKGIPYQWRKGESGNPGGRPAIRQLTDAYRQVLSLPHPQFPDMSYAQVIAVAMAMSATRGNVSAAAELGDRAEGRPITPKPSLFNGFGL